MKDPAVWQEYSRLLDEALDLPESEQANWLRALRAKNPEAATEVARLLGHLEPPVASTTRPGVAMADFHRALGDVLTGPGGAEALAAAEPGQRFGPWQVTRKLGEGGMGEVWLAERADSLFEGKAAIKLLRAQADGERLQTRFARERKLLGRLNHPGIARLLDAGISGSQPYLVLEYVEGQLLPDYLAAQQASVAARVALMLQVAQALATAHAQLIVHRDLKPANVMVTVEGRVKLLDFGIAGLIDNGEPADHTALTQLYGRGLTPAYAAPEQIAGEPTGVACDVYAFGVLLFELLTGDTPFAAQAKAGRTALEHAVLHVDAPRLSTALAAGSPRDGLPGRRPKDALRAQGDLESIVAKCLRKDPVARYSSMAAVIADLEHWLARRPVSAAGDDWRYRMGLWLRRNWLPASLATLAFTALAAGLAVSLVLYQRASAAQQRAEVSSEESNTIRRFLTDDVLASVDPNQRRIDKLSIVDVLAQASQLVEQRFAGKPRLAALTYLALADSYLSLQRNDAAAVVTQKALRLADAYPGAISANDRLYFLERAVSVLWAQSKLKEALFENDRLEQGWLALPPSPASREKVIQARLTRGSLLVLMGRNEEALALLQAVERSAVAWQQPDAIANDAAFRRSQALLGLGQYPQAVALLESCLARARAEGNAYSVAGIQSFLGQAYLYTGQLDAAAKTLADARAGLTAQLGDEHPVLDMQYAFEGELKLLQGEAAAARGLLEQAWRRIIDHYGEADTNLLLVAPPLVESLLQTGAAEAGFARATQALALSQRLIGPLDYRTLALQLALARSQQALGRDSEARATVLAAQAAALGLPAGHPLRQQWLKQGGSPP